jgi:hypothetical protein
MASVAWWVGATLAVPFVVQTLAYVRMALRMRRARTACPFDDDDHATLTLPRGLQVIVAETLLWWWTVATAAWPPAADGAPGPRPVPVVLVTPPGWPRSRVRTLAHRLRRDGFTVSCPRMRWRRAGTPAERSQAVDRALRAVRAATGARAVDVVAPASAAAFVARHLAAGGSGMPSVRRLLTVGAAGGDDPVVPPPTDVVALYALDDAWLGPAERARRRGALNVALRGVGRLGLLHAPHVYVVLREHLDEPAAPGTPSWTNVAS